MAIRDSRVPRLKMKEGWQTTPLVGLTDWKSVLALPDLDSEARITVADVLAAREAWMRDATGQYVNLLDAKLSHSRLPLEGG